MTTAKSAMSEFDTISSVIGSYTNAMSALATEACRRAVPPECGRYDNMDSHGAGLASGQADPGGDGDGLDRAGFVERRLQSDPGCAVAVGQVGSIENDPP